MPDSVTMSADPLTVDPDGSLSTPFDPEGPDQGPADPTAPYGRRSDGTPRSKPGRKPTGSSSNGSSSTRSSSTRKTAPPPPRKTTSGRKPPPKRPDYRAGIASLISLPAGVLGAVGAGLQRRDLVADAATVMTHAPGLAEGLNDLAGQDPRVAAVLDRVLAAGPYGALISAMVPMIAQIAANHGVIKPGTLGTMTQDQVIGSFGGGAGASPDDPA